MDVVGSEHHNPGHKMIVVMTHDTLNEHVGFTAMIQKP